MNRIQELIDEHKHEMPDGVAKKLLEECKRDLDRKPKLYRVHYTHIQSHAYVSNCPDIDEPIAHADLFEDTRHVIAELSSTSKCSCSYEMSEFMSKSVINEAWVALKKFPHVRPYGGDSFVIVHSVEPYAPPSKKRGRDADES